MDNDTRYKTTRLYVPKESIKKYEQKAAWNGAKGIYPLYPTDSISLPKEVSVILAKPTKIEYTILPENAGTKELKWSSEDPEVATVDENGVVTGMKLGETVITAIATDDSIVSATCKVTVMPSTAINGITVGNIKLTVENRCLKFEGLADNDIIKISDWIYCISRHRTQDISERIGCLHRGGERNNLENSCKVNRNM